MKYYLYYLGILNAVSLIYYGVDKFLASHKSKSRISEAWLLLLSIIGGPLGSLVGMYLFRHKTQKLKFYLVNYSTLIIWIILSIKFLINS